MYDNDDQRQALGQPSLNILMLKMIVVHKFFYYYFLPSKKASFIYMSLLYFSFVQYAVYDHVLSSYANIIWCLELKNQPMFGSITASQTSVQIVVV